VPAIVGLGKAAELAQYALHDYTKTKLLRDKLEAAISKLIPDARLNGHRQKRLPNTLNLLVPGLRGESMVIALDQHGISISSASACKAGYPEPSHVLLAMGRSKEEAHCSVRFSLCGDTTKEEIRRTVSALEQILKEKDMVRLAPCK
jgi:cysteine sulfinate desulfinase/cysteine desulfurase-like protein